MDEISRRSFVAGSLAAAASPVFAVTKDDQAEVLLGPEASEGWWAVDLASGRTLGQNPDLRLPMCSSFKWLLAAAVLSRTDHGIERLDRQISFGARDVVYNSPMVEGALKASGGASASLPVISLCEAAVSLSDSAAANLLLPMVGGPAGLTHWLRTNGNPVTRLDRYELVLNRVPAGDVRDTTTSRAMVSNLKHFLYGAGLGDRSKALLFNWLLAAKPGATRMPAGLRPGWRIAHKTGTWTVDPRDPPTERAASGDVAILLPPTGKTVLIAAYTAGSKRPQAEIDRWFAQLVRIVTDPEWLHRSDPCDARCHKSEFRQSQPPNRQ